MSSTEVCGVRDHAAGLARALDAEGLECSIHWLDRKETALAPARAEVGRWAQGVGAELERTWPDAVLLHYSVFAFSHRGLPLFGPPALAAARRARAPILTFAHEGAYNWHCHGAREAAWALSQRAVLIEVVRASAALLVTTDDRARWYGSRRWLAKRPTAVAPVFSNLPLAELRGGVAAPATVGLFGYSHDGSEPALVLDALYSLRADEVPVRLILLGAPGPDSDAGRRWRVAAAERGLAAALEFTGTLPSRQLASALSSCTVLLFADTPGPTSRKTALAAGLASASPVLALDGPRSWPALVEAHAALMVEPRVEELAGRLGELLADDGARAALAARGRSFYDAQMSVEHSARTVAVLLDQVLAAAPG